MGEGTPNFVDDDDYFYNFILNSGPTGGCHDFNGTTRAHFRGSTSEAVGREGGVGQNL